MTGNKRFVKKYIDEFNSEIDMVEKDILIISDELSGKIYYMDFLDDNEKEKTIDDIINNWNGLNDENQQLIRDNKTLLKHCENHGIIVPLNYERYKKYVEEK